jgi:hypothetical protein
VLVRFGAGGIGVRHRASVRESRARCLRGGGITRARSPPHRVESFHPGGGRRHHSARATPRIFDAGREDACR